MVHSKPRCSPSSKTASGRFTLIGKHIKLLSCLQFSDVISAFIPVQFGINQGPLDHRTFDSFQCVSNRSPVNKSFAVKLFRILVDFSEYLFSVHFFSSWIRMLKTSCNVAVSGILLTWKSLRSDSLSL